MQRHLLFFPAFKEEFADDTAFYQFTIYYVYASDSQPDTLLLISELQIHAPDPR